MSMYQYDENDWLVSLTRTIGEYVTSILDDETTDVEMSFPNTREWTKETPLAKSLIHFEQDDAMAPMWGFGNPGKTVVDDSDPDNPIVTNEEAAKHHVNFDVGVWTSAETGGATKRMQLVQAIYNMFAPMGARQALQEATNGIWVVSFEGGANILDHINDVPIWRGAGMTLVVEVFSRHVLAEPTYIPQDFSQDEELVIDVDGDLLPVVTETTS